MIENIAVTIAKVIKPNTDLENGSLIVRALPEHTDVEESLLPNALPFFGGYASETNVRYDSLKEGDMVWLLYERKTIAEFNPCYYIPFFSLPDNFNYSALTDRLSNVTDLEEYDYSSIFIQLFDNGDIVFRNKENGDSVYLKDINTYTYFKGTGEVFINTPEKEVTVDNNKAKISLAENGDIIIENEKCSITATSGGEITVANDKGSYTIGADGGLTQDSGAATLGVLSSGNIELNGNTKNFVTHMELDIALQTIITQLNTYFTTIATGSTAAISAAGLWLTPLQPVLLPLTLDISSAKTITVVTGG